MNNGNISDPNVVKKYVELIKKGGGVLRSPIPIQMTPIQGLSPAPYNPGPGRPSGTVLKDKDTIVQETVERLSEVIAKLCNRYNLSDSVQMTTEVDLVETANYTTVILTATIDWLPNPYVFVAQEKVKTNNKTAQNKTSTATTGTISPASVQGQVEQARQDMEIINRYLSKLESPK